MHVLLVPSWYKNPINPMVGSFFEEQARGLMTKGNKVGVFHIEYKAFSDKGELPQRKFIDDGIVTYQYYYKGLLPRLTRINYIHFFRKAYAKFKEYVAENGKPDILHAHSVFWGGMTARYISKKTGIPYVITEHLTSFVSGAITTNIDVSYAKKVFTDSSQNLVVSSTFKKDLSAKLGFPESKFHVIHNMVGNMFFENYIPKNILPNESIVFFTNSFITERKNHRMMMDAFKIFLKTYPGAKLLIGGGATNQNEIEVTATLVNYCRELGLSENVTFLGSLTRKQVKEHLDACHAFLLASKYETFGVVIIEALAAGRPVISTNSKGPLDILTKENSILVNSWEASDFADAMLTLIKNYSNYNQAAISKDCKNRFGEDFIVNELISQYKKVLAV